MISNEQYWDYLAEKALWEYNNQRLFKYFSATPYDSFIDPQIVEPWSIEKLEKLLNDSAKKKRK